MDEKFDICKILKLEKRRGMDASPPNTSYVIQAKIFFVRLKKYF
jgi:hypothetical protein